MLGMLTQLKIIQICYCVIMNDCIGDIYEIVVLCHCSCVADLIFLETVFYHLCCGLQFVMDINYSVLVSGCCCCCAINLIDNLEKFCNSCWVSVFQVLLIFIFNCVPLYVVFSGVLL